MPLIKKEIPLYLKNTFHPEQEGTLIGSNNNQVVDHKIQGVSSLERYCNHHGVWSWSCKTKRESQIGVSNLGGQQHQHHSNFAKLLRAKYRNWNQSKRFVDWAVKALDSAFEYEIERGLINPVRVIQDQSIIALIGDNMKNE